MQWLISIGLLVGMIVFFYFRKKKINNFENAYGDKLAIKILEQSDLATLKTHLKNVEKTNQKNNKVFQNAKKLNL